MAGARAHHFIPRLLLRRFASRVIGAKRKKYYVFAFDSSGHTFEANVDNVGQARDFYNIDVENNFSSFESEFASKLKDIDNGADPNEYHEFLCRALWFHIVRHRTIRLQFQETVHKLLNQLRHAPNHPSFTNQFQKELDSAIRQQIFGFINQMPGPVGDQWRRMWDIPGLQDMLVSKATNEFDYQEIESFFKLLVDILLKKGIIKDATRRGQIKALSRLLENSNNIPQHLVPVRWKVIEAEPMTVLLGDVCVIATDARGRPASPIRVGAGWEEMYFPISHSQILWSGRVQKPSLSVEQINDASIAMSKEYVYGASDYTLTSEQQAKIGSNSDILDDKEIQELVSNSYSEI